MKKKICTVILIIGFLLNAKDGVAQFVKHTPYPIIFVHGIVGNQGSWTDNPDGLTNNPENGIWDIIDFLHSGETPLESGGYINISLDYSRDNVNLNTEKENDVYVFNPVIPNFKDIYLVNFAVHAKTGAPFGDEGNFSYVNEEFLTNSEIIINVAEPEKFEVMDLISIDDEIMQIIAINGEELTVNRGQCNTQPSWHYMHLLKVGIIMVPFPISIFNMYKESNQAAVVKQGLGLKEAIDLVKSATGSEKVILVGHSMGGLAIREYIRTYFPARKDVAKIITIGTPHKGSNLAVIYKDLPTPILGMDLRSDAMRDLKTGGDDILHWILFGDLNTYLYGGNETNIEDEYYSKDVNCNGSIGEHIYGVNEFNYTPFPENLARTWIASKWQPLLINPLAVFGINDGIVLTKSQNLDSDDTLMTDKPHVSNLLGSSSIGESKDVYSLIRGLDEPADSSLAYKIDTNSVIKGFITYQKDVIPTDYDLFKINITVHSKVTIKMLASSSTGINFTALLDSNLTERKNTTDIYNNPMIDTLDAGTYYIRVKGTATDNSYQFPYTLTASCTVIPPNTLVASPEELLEYYDVVVNEYRDKIVSLTNSGSEDVSVTNVEITGTNADQFSVTSPTSFDVPALGSIDVTVRCNPTDTATKTANLVITNTSTDAPVITIPLHAIGVGSATRRLILVPDVTYNYGNVNITQNRTKVFKLKNTGSNALTVSDLALTGMNADAYSIIAQPTLPFDIETGIVKQVTVKFLPTTIGVKTADFAITSNADSTLPQHSITLYGNGKNSIYNGNYNTITAYEYWFDDNYASKVSTQVMPQQVSMLNTSISTVGLSTGLHRLHIRSKDNKGQWSSVISEVFHKLPVVAANTCKITEYEYWFDNDYAGKVNLQTAPQQIAILDSTFNTNSLSVGLHSYHTRFRDDGGQWSSVVTEVFHKLPIVAANTRKITEYEYWFDNDYAAKVTTNVAPQQIFTMNNGIDASALPVGLHYFHTRFRDDGKQWSSVVSEVFHKLNVSPSIPNLITDYRYWYDMDNSNMFSVSLPTPVNPYQLIRSINTCNLPSGDHRIHFQFKDLRQAWSSVITDTFNIPVPVIPVITPSGATTICAGSTITLTASTANSYLWNTEATSQSIIVSDSGSYSVSIQNECGVQLTSEAIHVALHPVPLPTVSGPSASVLGETVVYSTEASMSNYNWEVSAGGMIIAGAGTNSITVNWIDGGNQQVGVSYANDNGCSPVSPTILVVDVAVNRTLNLNVLLQGLYDGDGMMHKSQDSNGDKYPGTIADKVIIELHSAAADEYPTIVYSTGLVDLNNIGAISVDIPAMHNGMYYVTVKHRNSIETVSAVPIQFNGSVISYVFDTPSKAFGSNLLLTEDGYPVIYAGDVNHDGMVDAEDINQIYSGSILFSSGYLDTDINGDGIIDALDLIMTDNNASKFISVMKP